MGSDFGTGSGFAARAGLRSVVFVPSDLEHNKLLQAEVYGATLVTVDGNYDAVNRLCTQICDEYKWGFANINLRPFYGEGSKTVAFEIVEQMGWQAPDVIVVPMAGASLLTKIGKALGEMIGVGWLDEVTTRLVGAQAEGCSPVVNAYQPDAETVSPVVPETIAKSLAIGNPADGYYALQAIRAPGEDAEAADDDEIIEGIYLLARTEGIFTESAGGTVVAATRRLRAKGRLDLNERTVLCITGNGLKTPEALTSSRFQGIRLERAQLSAFTAAIEDREPVFA